MACSHLMRGLRERRNFVFEILQFKIVWPWIQGSGILFLRFVAKNVSLLISESNTSLTLVQVKSTTWRREWERKDSWSKNTPDYTGSSPEKFLAGSKLKDKYFCFRLKTFCMIQEIYHESKMDKTILNQIQGTSRNSFCEILIFILMPIMVKAGSCWLHSSNWLGESKRGKQNECCEQRKEHVL